MSAIKSFGLLKAVDKYQLSQHEPLISEQLSLYLQIYSYKNKREEYLGSKWDVYQALSTAIEDSPQRTSYREGIYTEFDASASLSVLESN